MPPAPSSGHNGSEASPEGRRILGQLTTRAGLWPQPVRSILRSRSTCRSSQSGWPHLQPNAYKDKKEIIIALRAAYDAGTPSAISEELLFRRIRPEEELYEYEKDPHQIHDLAANLDFAEILESHRKALDEILARTGDPAPESEAMHDSDMAEYLKRKNPEVEKNIATMKQWAAEGKRGQARMAR